jgi:hypothetical protein
MAKRGVICAVIAGTVILLTGAWAVADPSAAVRAAGRVRGATACPTETLSSPAGSQFPPVTYRFVLIGNVSCAVAHQTMRAYLRAIADGHCLARICTQVVFAGGFTCSSTSPVEQMDHGLLGGCQRAGGSFDVYRAGRMSPRPPACANVTVTVIRSPRLVVTSRFVLQRVTASEGDYAGCVQTATRARLKLYRVAGGTPTDDVPTTDAARADRPGPPG